MQTSTTYQRTIPNTQRNISQYRQPKSRFPGFETSCWRLVELFSNIKNNHKIKKDVMITDSWTITEHLHICHLIIKYMFFCTFFIVVLFLCMQAQGSFLYANAIDIKKILLLIISKGNKFYENVRKCLNFESDRKCTYFLFKQFCTHWYFFMYNMFKHRNIYSLTPPTIKLIVDRPINEFLLRKDTKKMKIKIIFRGQ